MAKKPLKHPEQIEVAYSEECWILLKALRKKAVEIMMPLELANLNSVTHGSIARGDVSEKSDIDVFVLNPPGSFQVESTLEKSGFSINRRILVQATPSYAAKAHVELDSQRVVSFPLMKMRQLERDFYRFGGEVSLEMLKSSRRVLGIDKRLMLIEPTEHGHVESSIVGREEIVAKLLHVSVEAVFDRVHALLRRDEIGRTGVFVERELTSDETFEMVLRKLAKVNPAVKRRLRLY